MEHVSAARAHANIALIKYWGKRAGPGNRPAAGSISITLDALASDTRVRFDAGLDGDQIQLPGGGDSARVAAFLDLVRERAGIDIRAEVVSRNNFPTGAGLASSASGFAALALAATRAAGLDLDGASLSALARRGSGSAARSVFGGFVEMRAEGDDPHAVPLPESEAWPLSTVIAIVDAAAKTVGSGEGMRHTALTSPYYAAWLDMVATDLPAMRAAIDARDPAAVGALAEANCLAMHGAMLAARPGLIYWRPATLALLDTIRGLRASGLAVYATIDAGPQVKALCAPEDADRVAAELGNVPGVVDTRISGLGPGAHTIDPDQVGETLPTAESRNRRGRK
jgi:diphosphomevalonate decarboxylase